MRVLLIVISTLAFSHAHTLEKEWTNFKAKYNKYYHDRLEEEKRMMIFAENLAEIERHNEKYKEGLVSFQMGMNHYGDMSQEEFERVMLGVEKRLSEGVYSTTPASESSGSSSTEGTEFPNTEVPTVYESHKRLKRSLEAKNFFNSIKTSSLDKLVSFLWLLFGGSNKQDDLAGTVDWVEKGAVTPVRDQGTCGSCWAFSATGALEGQLFRKTGKLEPLSIQNLVDCTKGLPYDNLGCEGGMMNSAFEYIRDYNIATEQSYPYEMKDSDCKQNTSTTYGTCLGYSEVSGERPIMRALKDVGPLSVVIDATSIQFRFYRKGLFQNENCASGGNLNHAVLAVGYGKLDGCGYWHIKNSWGEGWGDNGYMKIERRYSCGIDEYAIYPIV